MLLEKTAVPWSEELSNSLLQGGEVAIAAEAERIAVAVPERVVVSPRPERLEGELIVHDAKAQRVPAKDDTLLLAYLIEPSRPEYPLDELEAEYGLELEPDPPAEEETAALVRNAAATLRLRDLLLERVRERGMEPLYRDVELPLSPVLAAMEDTGVKIDEYRMGEITARLRDRVEELESRAYDLAGEEFMLGSTQQVGRILFEKLGLTPGRKGKTGFSTDTRVLRSIRGEHELVGVIEEWREYSKLLNTYLGPLPSMIAEDGRLHTTINQAVAATGRLSTTNPNLQAIPIRTELGREIRSRVHRRAGEQAALGRLLADRAAHPRARLRRAEAARGVRARRGHPHGDRGRGARRRARRADFGAALGREDDQLRDRLRNLVVRPLGEPRDPARGGAAVHRRVPGALPARAGLHPSGRSSSPSATATRRACSDGGDPSRSCARQNRQTRSLGERLAVNFVMQGSNADIIKVAMVRIHDRLREEGRGARLVLQVHDELLLEVPDAEVSAVKEIVREEMCGAYDARPAPRRRRRHRRRLERGEELKVPRRLRRRHDDFQLRVFDPSV